MRVLVKRFKKKKLVPKKMYNVKRYIVMPNKIVIDNKVVIVLC